MSKLSSSNILFLHLNVRTFMVDTRMCRFGFINRLLPSDSSLTSGFGDEPSCVLSEKFRKEHAFTSGCLIVGTFTLVMYVVISLSGARWRGASYTAGCSNRLWLLAPPDHNCRFFAMCPARVVIHPLTNFFMKCTYHTVVLHSEDNRGRQPMISP